MVTNPLGMKPFESSHGLRIRDLNVTVKPLVVTPMQCKLQQVSPCLSTAPRSTGARGAPTITIRALDNADVVVPVFQGITLCSGVCMQNCPLETQQYLLDINTVCTYGGASLMDLETRELLTPQRCVTRKKRSRASTAHAESSTSPEAQTGKVVVLHNLHHPYALVVVSVKPLSINMKTS